MGWSGGSEIFNNVISVVKDNVADERSRRAIYKGLIPAFEEGDWDTQDECLGKDAAYDKALYELHPDWYEEPTPEPVKVETPPTHEELCESGYGKSVLKSVSRVVDNGWRHGCDITQVWHRSTDNTYWSASYRISTDGEINELRKGECGIVRVFPKRVETVVYTSTAGDA